MVAGRFDLFRCRQPGIHAVRASSSHAFPKHTHDQFGIGVIQCGAQRSLSGRGMVEASAGDIITVNPGEVHDGLPIAGAERQWCMLYFDPEIASDIMSDLRGGNSGDFEFSAPVMPRHPAATAVMHLFQSLTKPDDGNALRSEELLLQVFAAIGREAPGNRWKAAPAAIRRAMSMLDDDPAEPVTLHALAAETGLTRFQLIRAFVKTTGLTPHAYQIQRRLQLARQMIGQKLPLAEIAAASGFSDQSHMNRLFTRTFGISPGGYARALT